MKIQQGQSQKVSVGIKLIDIYIVLNWAKNTMMHVLAVIIYYHYGQTLVKVLNQYSQKFLGA